MYLLKLFKKYLQKRVVSGLAIIIVAGLLSFFIVGSGSANSSVEAKEGKNSNSVLQFNSEKVEAAKSVSTSSITSEGNLTKKLSDAYMRALAKSNPEGLRNIKGQKSLALPSSKNAEKAGKELKEEMKDEFRIKRYSKEDIKIVENNSTSSQIQYLKKAGKVKSENFKEVDKSITRLVDDWFKNKNPEPIKKYINANLGQIESLLSMEVPSSWAEVHLQRVNLRKKKTKLFSSLVEYQKDPLKSMEALKRIPSVIEEGISLQEVIVDRYKELKKSQ